jgi:Uma2 family endonuclease
MSSVAAEKKMTPEEFLTWERAQPDKHEYYGGMIVAMSGGSPRHSRIAVNVASELRAAVRGSKCGAYQSDLRVWIEQLATFVYPDVSVVCGDPGPYGDREDVITNPTLVVEVLSPSTERYDRGQKFLAYQSLASLKEYILVSQDAKLIEQYVRNGTAWRYVAWLPEAGKVELRSVPGVLEFDEVYEGVDVAKVTTES